MGFLDQIKDPDELFATAERLGVDINATKSYEELFAAVDKAHNQQPHVMTQGTAPAAQPERPFTALGPAPDPEGTQFTRSGPYTKLDEQGNPMPAGRVDIRDEQGNIVGEDYFGTSLEDAKNFDLRKGGRNLLAGIIGAAGGVADFGDWLGGGDTAVGEFGQDLHQVAADISPKDPDFADKALQGAGSMGFFFVPGMGVSKGAQVIAKVAPRIARWLGVGTMSVLEAGAEAGPIYQQILEASGNEELANEKATEAFTSNLILLTATNKLGIFGETGGALRRGAMSAGMEGLQEAGQYGIESKVMGQEPGLWELLERAAIGGLVGGPAGVVAESVIGRQQEEVPAGVEEAAPEAAREIPATPPQQPILEPEQPITVEEAPGQGQEETGPEISETAPVSDVSGEGPRRPRPSTEMLPVEDIMVDPERFQYKRNATGKGGITQELQQVEEFDQDIAPAIHVWKDPADGKTYVVDGHHRRELAERTGAGVIESKYIKAATAEEAKFRGALINIANKQGTPVDAAWLFRREGVTPEVLLKKHNISVSNAVAKRGLALSRLDDWLLAAVERGDMSEARGVIIGELAPDPAAQRAIVKMLDAQEKKGKKVSAATLAELARDVAGTETIQQEQTDLFGSHMVEDSLAMEMAEIKGYIRSRIGKERQEHGALSDQAKAQRLAAAGNVINTEQNQAIAQKAGQAEEFFDSFSREPGAVRAALLQAAKDLKNGSNSTATKEQAYQEVRRAVADEIRIRFEGGARGSSGHQAGSLGLRPVAAGDRGRGSLSAVSKPEVDQADQPTKTDQQNEKIEVSGSEFGDDSTPINVLRSTARAFANEHFRDKSFINEDTGWEIHVNKTGINKTIAGNRTNIRLISKLDQLIQRSIRKKPKDGPEAGEHRQDAAKFFHRFQVTVHYDGKPIRVGVLVREDRNGKYHYSLYEWNEKKGGPAGYHPVAAPEGREEQAVSGPANKSVGSDQSSVNDVEKELGAAVKSEKGDTEPPAGMSVRKIPATARAAIKPAAGYQFQDEKIEARFEAAKGRKKPSLSEKVRLALTTLRNKALREFEHLPRIAKYTPLRAALLKLQKAKGTSHDRALRDLQGITVKLDPQEMDLFRRQVILDDLAEMVQEAAAKGEKATLPFGFDGPTVIKEQKRLSQHIQGMEFVEEALTLRKKLWGSLRGDYIKAMKAAGKDVKHLKRTNYFRHQILAYAEMARMKGSGKAKTPIGRSFLRKRTGSELDFNTDYFEAEYEVVAQMLHDIELAKVISLVDKEFDISAELMLEAINQKKEAEAKGKEPPDIEWQDLLPDGYTLWQPIEGNAFYMAHTVPETLAEELTELAIGKIAERMSDDKIKVGKALAVGRRRRELAIPEEVAATLDGLTPRRGENMFSLAARKMQKGWKIWALVSPRRWAKYNIRNVSGDAEAVFVGNPGAFKKLPKATKDLFEVFYGDNAMSQEMRDWFTRGGMESTLVGQEIGEVRMFKKFYEGAKDNAVKKGWKGYWRAAQMSTAWREAILRYSAYLDYLEQMQKSPDGKPKNFGASKPEEVMALSDIKDRAYWMANDLLGAYDRVGVFGQDLREYLIPFWSWKEVNFRRYVQLWRNACNDGKTTAALGRKVLGKAASPYTYYRIGRFAIKATAFWSMLQVWNHLVFPDEEKELPEEIRSRPHIVLGRDGNGEVMYFSRLGTLGDMLEWFGLDAAPSQVDKWLSGQASIKDIAQEMAQAPANVIWQGLSPLYKTPTETIARRSSYPNVFSWRTIRDRGLYIARQFGLENEYKAIAGLPSRGYAHSLKNLLIYRVDPGQAAYQDTMAAKHEFMQKIGKVGEGYWLTPKSDALYNFKLAMKMGDKQAAKDYLLEYMRQGGTGKGLVKSIQALDPLSGLKEKEKAAFIASLDEGGKERLKRAYSFYKSIISGGKK